MKILVTDQPAMFAGWVAHKVGQTASWGGHYALGLIDDQKKQVVAGVVLNNNNGANATVHIAMEPGVGRAMFKMFGAISDYAFRQLKLKRLTGLVPASEARTLKFDMNLGFEYEHTIKDGAPDGDMIMLVMWADKCKWLHGDSNGLESQQN